MQNDKEQEALPVYRFLGLCIKAGKLVSGEDTVLSAIRSGEARMVLVATDASANTNKMYTDKCAFYQVPLEFFGTAQGLGRAIGKNRRMALAVTDEGLAGALKDKLHTRDI